MFCFRSKTQRSSIQPSTKPISIMNSQPQSTPSGSHHRRSYTSLTQVDSSKEVLETPKEQKKHRSRHSLHHHFPHPYRRVKESQQTSSTTILGSNQCKQLNERHENVPSHPNESRRPSLVVVSDGITDQLVLRDALPTQDVERERQLMQIRNKSVEFILSSKDIVKLIATSNSELRTTLQSLSELSMSTTRNLDDIYYSILEKSSTLQNTINSLQELSLLTKQLHHDFDDRADELKEVWQEQINSFGGFNAQKERIDDLDGRIKTSREKADKLSSRLQAARERIGVLEVQEGEWQATVNRK